MANYKRHKPNSRQRPRCAYCTPYRNGNGKDSTKPKYRLQRETCEEI